MKRRKIYLILAKNGKKMKKEKTFKPMHCPKNWAQSTLDIQYGRGADNRNTQREHSKTIGHFSCHLGFPIVQLVFHKYVYFLSPEYGDRQPYRVFEKTSSVGCGKLFFLNHLFQIFFNLFKLIFYLFQTLSPGLNQYRSLFIPFPTLLLRRPLLVTQTTL